MFQTTASSTYVPSKAVVIKSSIFQTMPSYYFYFFCADARNEVSIKALVWPWDFLPHNFD